MLRVINERASVQRWVFVQLIVLLAILRSAVLAEVCSTSRVYRDVCVNNGDQYWDYIAGEAAVKEEASDCYEVTRRLGSGKFSEVMEAVDVRNDRRVVLKILKPVQAKKVKREIFICSRLAGGPNIVRLHGVCRNDQTDTTALVLEHLGEGARWLSDSPRHTSVPASATHRQTAPPNRAPLETPEAIDNLDVEDPWRMTAMEIRHYMYSLLQALDYCHSRGIMHRDVKPRNVVVNRATGELRLIDWGLGDFYFPQKRYTARVGSRYYKAPELLFGYRFYDYAVDVFGAGCVLAGLLFRREPFFRGRDNDDQLVRIACVLGTDGLNECLQKYGVTLEPQLEEALGRHRRKPWGSFVTNETAAVCTADALDLVDRMLCWDHQERISAAEAMRHPFFEPLKESGWLAQRPAAPDLVL